MSNCIDNYITCYMAGRLGNQMFQIANVYAQALRHNRNFRLTTTSSSKDSPVIHKDKMFRKLDFFSNAHTANMHYIQGTFHYNCYVPDNNKPTAFMGYFQSEKYFADFSQNIKWLYEPTQTFVEQTLKKYPQLNLKNTVAIHVRRGDFVIQTQSFPLITKEYILKALEQISEASQCFVVSDDIGWCKQNLTESNFIFVDYSCPSEALWFMSLCNHFVISNSTFSWWGAYLSRAANKKVVCPSTWFGPRFDPIKWDTKDLYCQDWIKIPTKYVDPGLIIPT